MVSNFMFFFLFLLLFFINLNLSYEEPQIECVDPNLEAPQNRYLLIGVDHPQFLELNVQGAGNISEVFLVNNDIKKTIPINLKECEIVNNIYNCTNITNILKDLKDDYLSNNYYIVEYDSECDNIRFKIKNKHIYIRKGYTLVNISPNWTFFDNILTQEVTLTYNEIIDGDIMVIFCKKGTLNYCSLGITLEVSNTKTITISFNASKLLLSEVSIYNIYSAINGQLNQRNNVLFKIVKNLDFTFNH